MNSAYWFRMPVGLSFQILEEEPFLLVRISFILPAVPLLVAGPVGFVEIRIRLAWRIKMNQPAPVLHKGSVPLILFGVPIHNLTFTSTLNWLDDLIERERSKQVATANLDFHRMAAEDPEMQRILFDADIVMADGHPIVKLSSFFGPRLKDRVTGSDITPMLAEHAAKKGHRLFFLGAAPGVAQKAADILTERHPGLKVVGCYSPEKADVFSMNNDEIIQLLEATRPDVLLVAFGAPKQEKWIQMHRGEWKIPVSMGIGASFDFITGAQIRSPVWMQKLGLEWLGRVLANPKRLIGRYLQDSVFLLTAMCRLIAIRIEPRGALSKPIDQMLELAELNSVYAELNSVDTLEAAEVAAARILELSSGNNIVVRPDSTKWLNSAELGVLAFLARSCRQQNKSLLVYPSSRRVEKLLYAQGLQRCFVIVKSKKDVVVQLKSRNAESVSGTVIRDENNKLIISLPAGLTASNKSMVSDLVFDEWNDTASECPSGVEINASSMCFIDCAGLSMLVSVIARAKEDSIPLSCSAFQTDVEQIIMENQLDWLL